MIILPEIIGGELLKLIESYFLNNSSKIQQELLIEVTKLSGDLLAWVRSKIEKSTNDEEKNHEKGI